MHLAHCSNDEKDEMYFFLLFLPLWLWNALVDVQRTAAKQSMFLPASHSSKVVKLMFYERQITPSWDNLQEIQNSVEQKEKTTKVGGEKKPAITFGASLSPAPVCFLNLGFPGIACASGDSVMGCM